jgi:hypothetical protein
MRDSLGAPLNRSLWILTRRYEAMQGNYDRFRCGNGRTVMIPLPKYVGTPNSDRLNAKELPAKNRS